jgi:predicted GNAT family acetyltransferase
LGEYNLEDGIISARRLIDSNSGYVWEADGIAVSLASVSKRIERYRHISHVYTPPHFQGTGYSTACCYNLTQQILNTGSKASLYADANNKASNRVYLKLGYNPVFYIEQYKII